MNKLGELLVALRKRNGLSQKNMANALQVSVSAISKWENNQNYPDLVLIPQIAELFHVSCDELLHPESTLEKLQTPSFQSETETPFTAKDYGMPDEADPMHQTFFVPKNKRFLFKWGIATFMLVVCFFIFPTCVNYYKRHTFRLMDTNRYVMTDLGPAYELVFYHPYKSTDEEMLVHSDRIEDLWQSGYYEDSTEKFLMVTYYLSKDDINKNKEIFFRAVYLLDETS